MKFPVLLAVVLCSNFVAAQNSSQSAPDTSSGKPVLVEETVVVTGNYEPVPLSESDRSVTSLPLQEIPGLFNSWADALQLDSSVDLQQRAPGGVQGDLTIRGSSFGQTLVLIDGIRMNDAQTGHNNLDIPVPFNSLDRIEVLRGSGSALYGSDAVGGAVNFITSAPRYTGIRLRAAVGNFGTNEQAVNLSWLHGPVSEVLSFDHDFSSGFMPDRDYRVLQFGSESRYQSRLGTSTVLLALSDKPFGADQFYGPFNSWERTKGWFAAFSQQFGSRTLASFAYRRHSDLFDLVRDHPEIYENNHVTESWEVALRRRDPLPKNAAVFYGAEWYHDSIDSSNLGVHQRGRGALYGGFDFRLLKRFSVSAGAREEIFEGGHAELSPTVSGGVWVTQRIKLRASASHAFRLPSYTDLYYSDPANVGNPNLRPETAWSYEGGGEAFLTHTIMFDATVFYRRERDGIDYVRSSPTDIWRAMNIDNLNFTGLETALRYRPSPTQSFEVAYTGLHGAQYALNGLESRYAFNYPIHNATIAWTGKLPAAFHARTRIGALKRIQRDPYAVWDAAVSRSFGLVTPFVQLTNLTSTSYQEIEGVQMPGRAIVAGFEILLRKKN